MSYLIANAAILSNATGLTTSSKMVLIALAQHADSAGHCWPSLERISQLSCLSERATRYALRKLEQLGLLHARHRLGTSTRYTLALSGAAEPVAPTPAAIAPPPRQTMPPNRSLEPLQEIHCAPPAQAPEPTPVPIAKTAAPLCVPDELKDIAPQVLQDFAIVRKTKKKAPMPTRTEAQDLAEQADRAGLTVAQAVRLCIVKGWARFEAAWVADRRSAQQDAAVVPSKPVEVWKPEAVNASPIPDEVRKRWAEMRAEIAGRATGTRSPVYV